MWASHDFLNPKTNWCRTTPSPPAPSAPQYPFSFASPAPSQQPQLPPYLFFYEICVEVCQSDKRPPRGLGCLYASHWYPSKLLRKFTTSAPNGACSVEVGLERRADLRSQLNQYPRVDRDVCTRHTYEPYFQLFCIVMNFLYFTGSLGNFASRVHAPPLPPHRCPPSRVLTVTA